MNKILSLVELMFAHIGARGDLARQGWRQKAPMDEGNQAQDREWPYSESRGWDSESRRVVVPRQT